jgi:hypothetical protein
MACVSCKGLLTLDDLVDFVAILIQLIREGLELFGRALWHAKSLRSIALMMVELSFKRIDGFNQAL